jgi:hypothetical protein
MDEFIIGVIFGIIVAITLGLSLKQAPQDNPEARVYCEMRKIFDDTGGEFGWPNYRNDIECINGEVK